MKRLFLSYFKHKFSKQLFALINKVAMYIIIFNFPILHSAQSDDYLFKIEQILKEPVDERSRLLLALANELESKNEKDEAIAVYKQIISTSSCRNEAIAIWLTLAEINRKDNQCEKSLNELDALNILLSANQEVKQKKFELLTELARASAKKGDNKKALEYFKLALETDSSKRLQVLREYADQLTFTTQSQLAIPLYQEVLASNPSQDEKKAALIGLARAYIWRGNYADAIKTNQLVLEIDPTYSQYNFFLTLARDAAARKKPEISSEYYKKAIDADPTKKNSLIREYAKQLSHANRADEAIILYKELLKTNLSQEETRLIRLDLAQAYVWTKQYPLAIAEYETILSQNPKDSEATAALVDLFISFARYEASKYNHTSALNWYLSAMSLNPDKRASLLREYADEVSKSGQGPEAIVLYKEILASHPSEEEARLTKLGLAQTYIWVNNHEEALKIYDELLKINPNDPEAKKGKAQVYIDYAHYDADKGNRSQAIEWFKKAIEINPDERPKLLKELADQLSYNSQVEEAISLYKEILSANPTGDNARAVHLSLAQAYASQLQYEEALKIYDSLLQKNKYDQIAKQGIAKIYVDYAIDDSKQNKHLEAINWYNKAIENDPSRRPELLLKIDEEKKAVLENKNPEPASIQLIEQPKEEKIDVIEEVRNSPQTSSDSKKLDKTETYKTSTATPSKIVINVFNTSLSDDIDCKSQIDNILKEPPERRDELLKALAEALKSKYGKGKAADCDNRAIESNSIKRSEPSQQIIKEDLSTDSFSYPCINENESYFLRSDDIKEPNHTETCDNLNKEYAKKAINTAHEHIKKLEVFQANRAFETALSLDSTNREHRKQYAWHLQAFSYIQEAVGQFSTLLPEESDKELFFKVLGWDSRALGQLDESISAFSHIYSIPCYYTLSNKFILIGNLYRREEYGKISDLWASLQECDDKEQIEVKKKIFDAHSYLGDVEEASALASEILSLYPDEYMVQYRFANLLYQKRKYSQSVMQYTQLIEKLPKNSFLYLSVGQVYEDMGCLCEAKASYEYAFYLDQNSKTERAYARILSKLSNCCEAVAISDSIILEENSELTKELSSAEVSLNCGDYETAGCIYNDILIDNPYNQEALWGLLKSSTYTKNSNDALLSYRRWPTIWFDSPLQNRLAPYYRPPECVISSEYFKSSTTFNRFSTGVQLNKYAFCNFRLYQGYYYTGFAQQHFNTINRHSCFLNVEKLINEKWECRVRLTEHYYNNLQHGSDSTLLLPSDQNLYSKGVLNYRLHAIYHPIPEITADIGYEYYDIIDTVPPFNNPIYNYNNQIGAIALNIRTHDWNAFFSYNKEKVSMIANFVYGHISDGNAKQSRSFRIDYRFMDVPVFNIYYSYFYLNYKNPAPLFTQNGLSENAYYDPKNLEIHSIGIDARYDITERLQVGGESAILYLPKVSNLAYSVFGYLNYQFRDPWTLRLDLRYYYQNQSVIRTGTSGYYNAYSGNLQAIYQF